MDPKEYLSKERGRAARSELRDGQAQTISGSYLHTVLATNIAGEMRHRLRNTECRVLNCGMRVHVPESGLFAYPDVQVVAHGPEFLDGCNDTLLNPRVIVEVLSDETAAWDQGVKFWHYRHVESLVEYLLVSHSTWMADHYVRQAGGSWMLRTVEGKDGSVSFVSAKCQLPLSEVYAHTGIGPDQSPSR